MSIEAAGLAMRHEQIHSNSEDATAHTNGQGPLVSGPCCPCLIRFNEPRGRDRFVEFQSRLFFLAPPDMCLDSEFKVRDPDFASFRQRLNIVGNYIRAGLRYFLDKTLQNRPAFNIEDFRPAERWKPRGTPFFMLPTKHD